MTIHRPYFRDRQAEAEATKSNYVAVWNQEGFLYPFTDEGNRHKRISVCPLSHSRKWWV